jgi:hypothetical protein
MPLFNIFYITEHVVHGNPGTDNQIIILYDELDGNYYYYGTRNREKQEKYINYSGKFHYTKLHQFVHFIDMLVDGFISHLTTEIHQIFIDTYDYDILNFNVIKSKLTDSTILTAYDKKRESYSKMYNYLETLVTHE